MKTLSIFNKRNYKFLFFRLKPYPKTVRNIPEDYSDFQNLESIIDYFDFKQYSKIVVVASGPSSNKIKWDKDAIYIGTNNSIEIIKNSNFIYFVSDHFYLTKYLKSFKDDFNWKGTIFWYYVNDKIKKSKTYKLLNTYLQTKSRKKKEFLICNDVNKDSKSIMNEVSDFLKMEFDFDFYGINSGFVATVMAFVFAYKTNKNLEIYGLDMGENGQGYFDNKNVEVGISIKGDYSKGIVSDFYKKVHFQSKIEVANHSYFKPKCD
jgi:hypothetical protein